MRPRKMRRPPNTHTWKKITPIFSVVHEWWWKWWWCVCVCFRAYLCSPVSMINRDFPTFSKQMSVPDIIVTYKYTLLYPYSYKTHQRVTFRKCVLINATNLFVFASQREVCICVFLFHFVRSLRSCTFLSAQFCRVLCIPTVHGMSSKKMFFFFRYFAYTVNRAGKSVTYEHFEYTLWK